MNNLFRNKLSHWEFTSIVLDNLIIRNELELELMTVWSELSRYSDEAWEEIGEGGRDNVRRIIVSLPKIGEILIRNKLQEDATVFTKLKQIIEEITGLPVKEIQMENDEEFEVEFENPIPRPRRNT